MPRKKEKKTFFRIKEKLVLVPTKKLLGRKFLGIICLVCGTLIVAGSAIYFYLVPNLFSNKTKSVEVREEKPLFLPKRILVPGLTLDFPVNNGKVEIRPPLKLGEFKKGEEIIVLSESEYRGFRVTQSKIGDGSAEPILIISGLKLKLILPMKITPPKILTIEAEHIE